MTDTPLASFLTILSGLCWTVVYVDGLRLGLKDRTYAIPFWALALNITWELLNTVIGYQQAGLVLQIGINALWLLLDIGILYTYFRFGGKYFPQNMKPRWFILWSLLGLVTALSLQIFFLLEFGLMAGAAYSAFLQNLLMSVLFIDMLVRRGNGDGQSLTIAVSKWLGTLAPTILFGVLGIKGFESSALILVIGLFCSVFDLIYIWMLAQVKARERRGEPGTVLS